MPAFHRTFYSILALWIFPVTAQPPEALAMQADAVLVVEVAFVPYGDLVLTREVLYGDKLSLPDPSEFSGPCLPGKAGVRQLAEPSSGPAAQIYREALERATYSAVLFLKREAGSLGPLCNETVINAEHWETHPNHAAWRAKVVSTLRARP